MKKLIAITASLIFAQSGYSCPDLAGSYKCSYEDGYTSTLKFEQLDNIYKMQNDGEETVLIADGIDRQEEGEIVNTGCIANTLVSSREESVEGVGVFRTTTTITKKRRIAQPSKLYLSKVEETILNGQEPEKDSVIITCTEKQSADVATDTVPQDVISAFTSGNDEATRKFFSESKENGKRVLEEVLVPNKVPLEDFKRFIALGGWQPLMLNRVYEVATLPAIKHVIENKYELVGNTPQVDPRKYEYPAFTIFKNYIYNYEYEGPEQKAKGIEMLMTVYESLPGGWIDQPNYYHDSISFRTLGKNIELTPLHFAVAKNITELVELMLSKCVKPTRKTTKGESAYNWAKRYGYKKLFKKWKRACGY